MQHRIDAQYPKETRWDEFATKLARHYKLPYGSRFALKRIGAAAKNARAMVRSDIQIRRKLFRKAEHPRDDNVRASEIFKRIENMLAPHHKFSVIGFGPDGTQITGQKSLHSWRDMMPKPTQQQIDDAWQRRDEIATLVKMVLTMIADLDEGIEDAERKIPQAVIQALLDYFGNTHIKDALAELRLV